MTPSLGCPAACKSTGHIEEVQFSFSARFMLLITAAHCKVPEHITHVGVAATCLKQMEGGGETPPLPLLLLRFSERHSRIASVLRTSNFGAGTTGAAPGTQLASVALIA